MLKYTNYKSIILLFLCITLAVVVYIYFLGKAEIMPLKFMPNWQTSVWLWDDASQWDSDAKEKLILNLQAWDVKTVYISFNEYLDMVDAVGNPELIAAYRTEMVDLLRRLDAGNLEVVALVGNQKWAGADYWYLPEKAVELVADINREQGKALVRGIQYNLEFYSLPEYQDQKEVMDADYYALVRRLRELTLAADVGLELTVPAWGREYVSEILAAGELPPLVFVIMAYRNQAQGEDGSIGISKELVELISAVEGGQFKIAQETNTLGVESPKLTFAGKTTAEMMHEVGLVHSFYESKPGYVGIAVHDYAGVVNLEKRAVEN